jgi:hypothetical protein
MAAFRARVNNHVAGLRREAFNGMSRRDWRIFWSSWFIGNAYWTFVCFGGGKALPWAWREVMQ